MTAEEAVLWNVTVSKDTDDTLRSYLKSQGFKEGDLSHFIEKAVRSFVFHKTIDEIHEHNRHLDPAIIEADIDEALAEVRADARAKLKQTS
jgi:hypothetical protein